MKNKVLLISILLFVNIRQVVAQAPNWGVDIGGSNYDQGNSTVIDSYGNIYTTGAFRETVDFDPGPGTFNLYAGGFLNDNTFISKLDSVGNFIWAKAFNGFRNGGESIVLDSSGNVYSTGYFSGTVDFDPGNGVFNLASNFGSAFINKLDSNGNFIWAKAIGSLNTNGGTADGSSIFITPNGSGTICITGTFSDVIDFDPDSLGVFNLSTLNHSYGVFVLKLDSSGDFLWAKAIDGTGDDRSFSIAVDALGNCFTTGHFTGVCDFDPGVGVYNLTSNVGSNFFISKLDSLGNFVWAVKIDAAGDSKSITLDTFANVYTTGNFYGPADFDPGSGTFILNSVDPDIFISKLDSSGNFVFAKAIGGPGDQVGNSIALDKFRNIYTTGGFIGTTDFDPDSGIFNLTSNGIGIHNIFISKLDSIGNFVCAQAIAGNGNDFGKSIVVNTNGNIHLTGYFSSTSIIINLDTLTNSGNDDIFIAKLDCKIVTGMNEFVNNAGFDVFPNPFNGTLTIQPGSSGISNFELLDLAGRVLLQKQISHSETLDMSAFSNGIYIVRATNLNGRSCYGKVIKN